MIQIDHLQVAGKLRGITLTVAPGEIVAVVGSRGSGKTTLMRALAGQQPISGGTATVNGVSVQDPSCRPLCGVAGESWGLMERLTVWENLTTFARLWGASEERVADLVKRLDLVGRMQSRVDQLRPGELARLRLARALLHDPSALLLDEPVGDIDGESASLITFTIAEEAEVGKAVLLTTFGSPRAMQIATRLCYLEDGRLVEPSPEPSPAPAPTSGATSPVPEPARGVPSPAPTPVREAPAAALPAGQVPHIAARKGDRVLLFRPEEIRYAYAQEKAVYIQTPEGECAVSFTLTDLEERLGEHGFFRCHRAYLVNVGWVKEIASWTRDSYSLILKDGKDVPLSKHRAHELRVRLNW
jgi:ABC-2 type transport system ATP-binding protein